MLTVAKYEYDNNKNNTLISVDNITYNTNYKLRSVYSEDNRLVSSTKVFRNNNTKTESSYLYYAYTFNDKKIHTSVTIQTDRNHPGFEVKFDNSDEVDSRETNINTDGFNKYLFVKDTINEQGLTEENIRYDNKEITYVYYINKKTITQKNTTYKDEDLVVETVQERLSDVGGSSFFVYCDDTFKYDDNKNVIEQDQKQFDYETRKYNHYKFKYEYNGDEVIENTISIEGDETRNVQLIKTIDKPEEKIIQYINPNYGEVFTKYNEDKKPIYREMKDRKEYWVYDKEKNIEIHKEEITTREKPKEIKPNVTQLNPIKKEKRITFIIYNSDNNPETEYYFNSDETIYDLINELYFK